MKNLFALMLVGSMVAFAACTSTPKTEEAAVDSTAVVVDSAATAVVDSAAAVVVDSAAAVAK